VFEAFADRGIGDSLHEKLRERRDAGQRVPTPFVRTPAASRPPRQPTAPNDDLFVQAFLNRRDFRHHGEDKALTRRRPLKNDAEMFTTTARPCHRQLVSVVLHPARHAPTGRR